MAFQLQEVVVADDHTVSLALHETSEYLVGCGTPFGRGHRVDFQVAWRERCSKRDEVHEKLDFLVVPPAPLAQGGIAQNAARIIQDSSFGIATRKPDGLPTRTHEVQCTQTECEKGCVTL